jgi:hypothetical protein
MGRSSNYVGEMRKIWSQTVKAHGINGKYYPATASFEELISNQRSENIKYVHPSLRNWICVLDEFALYFFTLYLVCFTRQFVKRRSSKVQTTEVVNVFLLGAIVNQLVVVRTLALGGFDANVKHSARLLAEYVDVFNFLQLNPTLIEEFHASHISPAETNNFWHKYISKGKLRPRVLSGIDIAFPEVGAYLREMEDWRKEELKVISAFAHPSFIAAYTSATVGGTYNRGGSGILGRPDLHSIRALRFVFYSLAEFVMFNVRLDFAMFALTPKRGKKDELIPWIIERKPFITRLIIRILSHDMDHAALNVPAKWMSEL